VGPGYASQTRPPLWIRLLPESLRERLAKRVALHAIVENSGWLIFDKLLRMAMGLLVTAWVARYLGPESFGELAYVLAQIAFFQVVGTLGADGIVVRDIARNRDDAPTLLGTLFAMRVAVGVICWAIAVGVAAISHGPGERIVLLMALAGGSLVFQAADTADLWFQSQSQSRRTVLAKLGALLLSNGCKVLLILVRAPLIAFAAVVAFEALVAAVGMAVVYRRFPTPGRWHVVAGQATLLLRQTWPFMLSGLSVMVYMRIDQIMIKNMLGGRALGIYAAALSVSQLWNVIPTTLVISLAPYIARRKMLGEAQYESALLLLFRVFGAVSLVVSAVTALASPMVVRLLYGSQYLQAAPILAIHVFSNFFVFQGVAQSLWLTNERAGGVALMKTLLGGIAAVCANLVLLPRFGVLGAAVSALVSFGISAVFSNLLYAPKIFLMQFGIRTPVNA
jgi:O-antigen/teichoic acid export membrane protein